MSPPPLVISFLLVEAAIGWQEDHYHAHACSPLHDVGTVLPTPSDHGCSFSSCRTGDKMFYHPLCGGSPPLSSANFWSVILFFSIHTENQLLPPCIGLSIVFIHHSGLQRKLVGFFPLIDGSGFPHALLTELPTMQHWWKIGVILLVNPH